MALVKIEATVDGKALDVKVEGDDAIVNQIRNAVLTICGTYMSKLTKLDVK